MDMFDVKNPKSQKHIGKCEMLAYDNVAKVLLQCNWKTHRSCLTLVYSNIKYVYQSNKWLIYFITVIFTIYLLPKILILKQNLPISNIVKYAAQKLNENFVERKLVSYLFVKSSFPKIVIVKLQRYAIVPKSDRTL